VFVVGEFRGMVVLDAKLFMQCIARAYCTVKGLVHFGHVEPLASVLVDESSDWSREAAYARDEARELGLLLLDADVRYEAWGTGTDWTRRRDPTENPPCQNVIGSAGGRDRRVIVDECHPQTRAQLITRYTVDDLDVCAGVGRASVCC
jgi:hypothetical protein